MDKALWGKSGHTGKSIRTRIETRKKLVDGLSGVASYREIHKNKD